MRIVFVISGLGTGGAENMLFKLLERLDRSRFSAYVISLTTMGDLGPRITRLGIPVEALGFRLGLPNLICFIALVWRIRRLRADVVHTWMYHADLLGGLAARLAGLSTVAWGIRNSNLDRDKTRWSTRVVVRLCAALSGWLPKRIMSCSEAAKRIHISLGYAAERMLVVPNGFDLARYKPDTGARRKIRAELGIPDEIPVVGLMGRFDPQKNIAGFFEAAGMLHRRMPQARFVLAGRGVDWDNEALMRSASRAGVLANTHLLGLRDDMPDLMVALDILVSSSYGEAFPNVLGEAMACGVPCAVTDVGDSAYILGDTGRVVPAGDMPGLAAAMEDLLAMPESERAVLGERARARVSRCFAIDQVVRQYEDFYASLFADA